MKIVLPWPDPRVSPNAKRRKHWRTYQPAIKSDRFAAHMLTLDAMNDAGVSARAFEGEDPIELAVTFFPPDRRHRDDDGMIGSFKHQRDGIADALHCNDRRFRPHYHFAAAEKPGRVEVVVVCPQDNCTSDSCSPVASGAAEMPPIESKAA